MEMVGFQGRFGSTQYTQKKPVKWGIKAFTLADANTGWLYAQHLGVHWSSNPRWCWSPVYLPASANTSSAASCFTLLGKGPPRILWQVLLQFSSGTNLSRAANTIHRHKCQKQSWSSFTLGDNDTMQFRCEQLIVIAWRAKSEKTPVIMVSSACSAGMTEVHNRKGEVLQKPVVVDTYNHSINGVGRNDQHCTYYSFVRKILKWWKKMFFYLLECSTVNNYILY